MSDPDLLLRVENLRAGYRQPVVGPVSLTLRRGERLGMSGANGSGKSTLLKAIARAAQVFSGHIERAPAVQVAYLEQQPVRLAAMPITGQELLRVAGATRFPPPAGLAGLLKRRLDRLSGGQYQLLWIWCALASAADVVLLDEPTNNLDPTHCAMLSALLQCLCDEQALLIVSHDREFLMKSCTRQLELDWVQSRRVG
ncbi:ATP-binding cassette domain-containing protein [Thiospirillum jenense]|uniref:ATP-binding cassette domain-containing protein n=1 Tax=Thiospirillum jenense TaxID=1653858 RepID=A0A839HF39_9GAMM|nr:ATP-binding cassette domain-containing protein [Thiospirillum jenense]